MLVALTAFATTLATEYAVRGDESVARAMVVDFRDRLVALVIWILGLVVGFWLFAALLGRLIQKLF